MGHSFDFSGVSLSEIEGSLNALANEELSGGDLLPDLSNVPTSFVNNCSTHPFEA